LKLVGATGRRAAWELVRLPGIAPIEWPCASTTVARSHSAVKSQPLN
jgi:hypothetical protein